MLALGIYSLFIEIKGHVIDLRRLVHISDFFCLFSLEAGKNVLVYLEKEIIFDFDALVIA